MTSDKFLQKINSPTDLKALKISELNQYAEELREYIITTVSRQGGHLSSNLGTIELTLALHYIFNTPTDKILWDVGHQSYAHKIITGRRDSFKNLRTNEGITGFPNTSESEHDIFNMGHSSTSLSVGLGIARARDLRKENYNIISVIGDGALTGGMSYEAMNDIGDSKTKMIIILNDNEMSISKNVGAIANYLAKLRQSKGYSKFKYNIKRAFSTLPFFGDKIISGMEKVRDIARVSLQNNKMFEQMGIKYYGPFDGHNIENLINIIGGAKNETKPVLIHILTNKGQGFHDAEIDPGKYHGVAPDKNEFSKNFSSVTGEKLCELAGKNDKIVAITAAMCDGTGLKCFEENFKDRYFDVGIAEQHAVTMAAGLAANGLKPYFVVYSSFLQRGYDQIVNDVCLNNLPVTLLTDRAGVIGSDGVTHQGIFDLSYLNMIPNMTVLSPKDGRELEKMLEWSQTFNSPLAIRYPKNYKTDFTICSEIEYGKWEVLKESSENVYILAVGNRMLDIAHKVNDSTIINVRFIKPLDAALLDNINKKNNIIITLEDNVLSGGFGEKVLSYLNGGNGLKAKIELFGLKDSFITNLDTQETFENNGLTAENILQTINRLQNNK